MRLKVLLKPCDLSCLIEAGHCTPESSWVPTEPMFGPGCGSGPRCPLRPPQVRRAARARAPRAGGSGKNGTKRRGLMCQCVGHNKGSPLPFETQRESPEESAETVPMRPYICNPLRAPPRPVPLPSPAAKPCFSKDEHRTQLISFPRALPPSFSRSLLSPEPETHRCAAGAGGRGHTRTPAAAGPSAGDRCEG